MYRQNRVIFLISCTFLLGIILRFLYLDKYPIQLGHDEVTQAYDAISIAQTGKDIYGNYLPFIFESVHDFKPPFYTYATAATYLIFGDKEVTVRIPGAIFSIFIILGVFLLTFKIFKNLKVALISVTLTVIAPFEIFYGRKSFENGAGIFLMLIGYFFLLSFPKKRAFLSAFFLAAAMYTYFSHFIIIPLLFLATIFIYKDKFFSSSKRIFFSKFLGLIVTFILLVTPLIYLVLTNPTATLRSRNVFITQDINLGKEISLAKTGNNTLDKFLEAKIILEYSFGRLLNQFDPRFIFGNGLELTNQKKLGIGPLYLVSLPFLVLGIIGLIRNKRLAETKKFVLAWIGLGVLPSALTFETHSPHRSIMVFTMLNILSAYGVYIWIKWVKTLKNPVLRSSSISLVVLFFFFNLIYFLHIYFVNYPFEKSESLHYPYREVSLYAWSNYSKFDQIIFDPLFGEAAPVIGTGAHYYLAYYGKYPPEKFQREYKIGSKSREVIFDKFSIREFQWPQDLDLKNTLIIISPWTLPKDVLERTQTDKKFYFYDGKLAFVAIHLK